MALLFGGLVGTILILVILFYLLKLFSIAVFNIHGSDTVFHFFIVIIPYIIFFSGYYYLHKKITLSKSKTATVIARAFLIIGSLFCVCTMILSSLKLFGVQKNFLLTYEDNSQYAWIIQIVMLFFTALIIASGDAKEKNWIDKKIISDEL